MSVMVFHRELETQLLRVLSLYRGVVVVVASVDSVDNPVMGCGRGSEAGGQPVRPGPTKLHVPVDVGTAFTSCSHRDM